MPQCSLRQYKILFLYINLRFYRLFTFLVLCFFQQDERKNENENNLRIG